MKLLEQFSSELNDNVSAVYYFFILAFMILTIASFGCLYAIFIYDLPMAGLIVFLVGFLLLSKQSYDAAKAILSLSRFVVKLTIFNEGLELIIVPNRRLFYKKNEIENVSLMKKRSHLFNKILPKKSDLLEFVLAETKYNIALNNGKSEFFLDFIKNKTG